jgi:hypothetical protein
MNDLELNVRVGNRMLNKIMKREYGYDCFFRINPINYLNNRVLIPKKVHLSEIVYVKLKRSITFDEREKMRKDLNVKINLLFNLIEGIVYRPILDIKLKFIQ